MGQFASAFTSGVSGSVAIIGDSLEYRQIVYSCALGEENYGSTLGEGGFEVSREITASVPLANAPTFRLGDRVKITSASTTRSFRITGIRTDEASVDLSLTSPETK